MPFMYPIFDSTYFLVVIGLVISLAAQAYVKSAFAKYSQIASRKGITATQAAQYILDQSGIRDVRIERVRGELTDHYDARNKVLRLSDSTANSTSVAAIGVAAHEVGHAIQDQVGYVPLRLRHALVPAANIGQGISMPMILIGLVLGSGGNFLIQLGILMFSLTFVFQVVTLPVEFNASNRALQILGGGNILERDEVPKAQKVLNAAALTYVAAAIMSFLQLLRLILLFGGRRRD